MRPILVLCVATLLTAAACGPASDPAPAIDVPRTDLDSLNERVRARVVEATGVVEARLADGAGPVAVAEALVDLGMLYAAYRFFEPAVSCFGQAATLTPDAFEPRYYLGYVLQAAGRMDEAAEAYRAALTIRGRDLPALRRLGNTHLSRGDAAAAEQTFQLALTHAPEDAGVLYGLGRAHAMAGDNREAVQHLERALELQPQASTVHYQLGQLYRRLGDTARAREHLEQHGEAQLRVSDPLAVEIARLKVSSAFDVVEQLLGDPEGFSEDDIVGYALVQFGDIDGAVEELERTMTSDAQSQEAAARARMHYVLGVLYLRQQAGDAALEHLRTALRLDPGFDRGQLLLATALAMGGDTAAAVGELDTLLARTPAHPRALRARAGLLTRMGRPRDALVDLVELARLEPDDGAVRLRLGALHERLGDAASAAGEYERALESGGIDDADRATAHVRLADLYFAGGAVGQAAEQYAAALAIEPAFLQASLGLGRSLVATGRSPAALDVYVGAVRHDPQSEAARVGEASVLILLGRHAEARQRLEDGVKKLPASVPLARTLARHLAACPVDTLRDGRRALELAEALAAGPGTFDDRETLAMALAETGEFERAASLQQGLLDTARQARDGATSARLAANLERYRAGRACCAQSSR